MMKSSRHRKYSLMKNCQKGESSRGIFFIISKWLPGSFRRKLLLRSKVLGRFYLNRLIMRHINTSNCSTEEAKVYQFINSLNKWKQLIITTNVKNRYSNNTAYLQAAVLRNKQLAN